MLKTSAGLYVLKNMACFSEKRKKRAVFRAFFSRPPSH
jgi:predicted RNA-binding protein YlxR (DUF448 family)